MYCLVVTSHNDNRRQTWVNVKVELIRRYGTIRNAASELGCHYNSPRLAAFGKAPRVAELLKRRLPQVRRFFK
jgi:hypothetical protein